MKIPIDPLLLPGMNATQNERGKNDVQPFNAEVNKEPRKHFNLFLHCLLSFPPFEMEEQPSKAM